MKNKNRMRTLYNKQMHHLRATVRSTMIRMAIGLGVVAFFIHHLSPSTAKPRRASLANIIQPELQRER